jgi:hypothetical protein
MKTLERKTGYLLMATTPNEFEITLPQPYRVVEDNLISVCMCCFPGSTIIDRFPDLAGVQISHGICKMHADRWKADIKIDRMAKELRGNNTAYAAMKSRKYIAD